MLRVLALLLALLIGADPVLGQGSDPESDLCLRRSGSDDTDLSLKCRPSAGAAAVAFATGCYYSNATDDRKIVSGIPAARAGMLRICEQTVQAGNNNCCVWKTPEMGALSCGFTNCDLEATGGFQQCGSNDIQSFNDDGTFTIGNNTAVNPAGARAFCWEMWEAGADYHDTFSWVGDGSSPRTITLLSQPDMAVAHEVNNASSNDNIPMLRTKDMPATHSYYASSFATVVNVQGLRAFGSKNITVGTSMNEAGKTYYGAWWKEGPKLDVGTYTGNGTDLDAGKCGSLSATQTQTAACSPVRDVWLQAINFYPDLGAGLCTLTRSNGPCMHWRTSSTGINVTGAGFIPGTTDLYAFAAIQPNNSGPGIIGGLTVDPAAQYTVTGGPNLAASCNDNAIPVYTMATCASGPSIGTSTPVDWSADAKAVAVWQFESEVAGDAAINKRNNPIGASGTFLCGYPDCDMADNGTMTRSTTEKRLGQNSLQLSGTGQYGSCALSGGSDPCEEFDLGGPATSFTVGCFARVDTDTDHAIISKAVSGSLSHWRLGRASASDSLFFEVRDTGGTQRTHTQVGYPITTWIHAMGEFDNTGNVVRASVNGLNSASAAIATDATQGTGTVFNLGRNAATLAGLVDGNLDECFAWAGLFTATQKCRIASCGLSGTACSCLASDPTLYVDTGYNGSIGAGCTLPVCNASAP